MSEQALASGTAAAFDQPFAIGVIVVGQLFAAPDLPRGADPDDAAGDVHVAVRPAAVIDEARDIAADRGVDDGAVRQLEAPHAAAFDVAALALQALLVRNLLARVIDDAFVLRDRLGRVDAPSMDLRSPLFDH